MTNKARTLAIIPARQGSKRLPGKNLLLLAGKPLIQWSIEAAQQSRAIDEVLVTSDDATVLALAQQLGVNHVLERPKDLASDIAKTSDVIRHALAYRMQLDNRPETICLLQATSPLRTAADIDGAHTLYTRSGAPSVISVCELEHPLAWCSTLDASHSMKSFLKNLLQEKRSQDLEKCYRINGAIYISEAAFLMKTGGFLSEETLAYIMPRCRSIDIDDRIDFCFAKSILECDF
ncbi:acylneuraminate cytidylyltransferase family protein [Halomonas daqingensis]|uniref:acylneuraminate cytidylyltransferase family protein n=1 Tax=Billgrantia desiderata TaxID=52021 RepID=UPI001F3671EE|nr:acylneuraminate cytidylyltransferase family protein [Halomonas desiderata]MCE8027083.1 acylneuraminate cytidylyltransferase family protein [Halomonas desiderata]